MPIAESLIKLRVNIRKNSKRIVDNLIENFLIYRSSRNNFIVNHQCLFCGETEDLTREHILPKWLFENIQNKFYVNGVNGQKRSYAEATVPACRVCNSELLNEIERHIKNTFTTKPVGTNSYTEEDFENIIRWLEIIHYKLQVTDLIQRFIKHKDGRMVEYLRQMPLAILREGGISPFRVEVELRNSIRRISIKSKADRSGSLAFFITKNTTFHFFHNDHFIFIELPQYKLAVFYFYKKNFKSEQELGLAVQKEIEKYYN
jgi:uncharacterized CHY-type Zn-finger protein